jgi:hypothetical protein
MMLAGEGGRGIGFVNYQTANFPTRVARLHIKKEIP